MFIIIIQWKIIHISKNLRRTVFKCSLLNTMCFFVIQILQVKCTGNKSICKFQLWLPWLAGLPYQFSTIKQRTSFSVMEEWEGVLGRGDGVNEGDVPDAEWFPLMKSGGCNLEERGLPPRLLGVVAAANSDPVILWSCDVSRKLVSTSVDKRIPSE